MAEPISVNQLKAYRQAVETRGVVGVVEVYAELYSQGYTYAGWALGVAAGDTTSGQAAN